MDGDEVSVVIRFCTECSRLLSVPYHNSGSNLRGIAQRSVCLKLQRIFIVRAEMVATRTREILRETQASPS